MAAQGNAAKNTPDKSGRNTASTDKPGRDNPDYSLG